MKHTIICFSQEYLVRLVRSTAVCVALENGTHARWHPYNESIIVKVLTYAVNGHGPGWYEVDQDMNKINQLTAKLNEEFWTGMMDAFNCDAATGIGYLEKLELKRSQSKQNINKFFQSISSMNGHLVSEARTTLNVLSAVRLTSTIVVTVVPAVGVLAVGAGGVILGASLASMGEVALGYSLASAAAKELVTADTLAGGTGATIVAMSTEVAKDKVPGAVAKMTGIIQAEHENALRDAERIIEQQSKKLARDISESKKAQALRRLGRAEASSAANASKLGISKVASTAARGAARFLPIVFAAKDVWDDVQNFER